MQNFLEFILSDAPKKVMDGILSVHSIADEGSTSKYRDITGNVLQRLIDLPPERLQRKYDAYKAGIKPHLLHKGVIAYLKNTKWENPETERTITYEHEGRTMEVNTSLREIDTNLKDYLCQKVLEAALSPPGPEKEEPAEKRVRG